MSEERVFQQRINFQGDLRFLLSRVCEDFGLGDYKLHRVITVGYEDLNILVCSNTDSYLVKILAGFRDENDRLRYSEIIQEVAKSEVAHPKLYQSNQGYLYSITLEKSTTHLFVMQFISGKSFYDLGTRPSKQEIAFLSRQAALINQFVIKPQYMYDSWAIVNFVKEYEEVKFHLEKQDVDLIEPLSLQFREIDLNSLPHCFVHGDIIETNVLKDEQDNLWIIDFAVSNFNPRIQELAILGCNLLFDEKNQGEFLDNYYLALDEYGKVIMLTEPEINLLPVFIQVAHAMHIIGATKSKLKGEDSKENQYWFRTGRQGLSFTTKIW